MSEVRLFPPTEPLDPELVERFSRIPVSNLSDVLERMAGFPGIQPVGGSLSSLGGRAMVGPALTVRTRPGDNLVVHKALDLARPGDVLVVDARGELVNAILGELMAEYAATRGIAGLVVDGAVRDQNSLSGGRIPVFARGFSHLGPYKNGPGEIHGPVSIAGVAVNDGDVVLGDADGVAVVPRARARQALEAAEQVVAKEADQMRAIRAGTWDRSWVDASLKVVEVEGG
ncbi:RraA family protein [Geodermatophilus sp. YIM 151500]|uniref:RraA family protein n=1 Tax=Geodermatophilus sp. YIM 151500 TaxID=2984531 RepID=UPI0021E36805|nr:RraA family protein [Geodermatophilus sp. YIM 151500]MCV2488189.1 RraA family protein [Geodermatophilus sp. YIM 151500]